METLLIIAVLAASHVAAFFAGAHNANRANALKKAAKDLAEAAKK